MAKPHRNRPHPRRRIAFAAAAALAAGSLAPSPALPEGSEVVAVVNAGNPISEISVKQLRLLYGTYKRTWGEGTRVHLLLPPSGDPGMRFLIERVFRVHSEADIAGYYLGAIFQQKISQQPPQPPQDIALDTVRGTPGAIVVLARASIADATGLRALPIRD